MKYIFILLLPCFSLLAQEQENPTRNKSESKVSKEEIIKIESSSELQSEADNMNMTQSKIRQEKKIETSFSQSFFSDFRDRCEALKVQFSINSYFSIGASDHYSRKYSESYSARPFSLGYAL